MVPKLVITDIDGVWTDGGMYYDQMGNEWKKFVTSDSAGVIFLRLLDIPLAILSGEDTEIVKRRAAKLRIKHVFLGVRNKLQCAQQLCEQLGISLSEVAFIGDDINDIPLLRHAGLSAVPAHSPEYVASEANWQMKNKGGEGVFREFVERILCENNLFDLALERYEQEITKA